MFKVLAFDLEMSNLNADFGVLLCGVIKDVNSKEIQAYDLRAFQPSRQPWNDKALAFRIREVLASADAIVSFNGRYFDVPFLNARLMYYGQPPLPRIKHEDLYWLARKHLKLHSRSMDTLARHLCLKAQKTRWEPWRWTRALCGEKESFDYILQHCVADVEVLDEAFERMKHFMHWLKE